MEKLSNEQLLEKLNEHFDGDVSSYVGENVSSFQDEFGKIETVEDVGGGEGEGETRYIVRHFVDHDIYLKTTGYYASHYGEDWDNGFGTIVRPVERMTTYYE